MDPVPQRVAGHAGLERHGSGASGCHDSIGFNREGAGSTRIAQVSEVHRVLVGLSCPQFGIHIRTSADDGEVCVHAGTVNEDAERVQRLRSEPAQEIDIIIHAGIDRAVRDGVPGHRQQGVAESGQGGRRGVQDKGHGRSDAAGRPVVGIERTQVPVIVPQVDHDGVGIGGCRGSELEPVTRCQHLSQLQLVRTGEGDIGQGALDLHLAGHFCEGIAGEEIARLGGRQARLDDEGVPDSGHGPGHTVDRRHFRAVLVLDFGRIPRSERGLERTCGRAGIVGPVAVHPDLLRGAGEPSCARGRGKPVLAAGRREGPELGGHADIAVVLAHSGAQPVVPGELGAVLTTHRDDGNTHTVAVVRGGQTVQLVGRAVVVAVGAPRSRRRGRSAIGAHERQGRCRCLHRNRNIAGNIGGIDGHRSSPNRLGAVSAPQESSGAASFLNRGEPCDRAVRDADEPLAIRTRGVVEPGLQDRLQRDGRGRDDLDYQQRVDAQHASAVGLDNGDRQHILRDRRACCQAQSHQKC